MVSAELHSFRAMFNPIADHTDTHSLWEGFETKLEKLSDKHFLFKNIKYSNDCKWYG